MCGGNLLFLMFIIGNKAMKNDDESSNVNITTKSEYREHIRDRFLSRTGISHEALNVILNNLRIEALARPPANELLELALFYLSNHEISMWNHSGKDMCGMITLLTSMAFCVDPPCLKGIRGWKIFGSGKLNKVLLDRIITPVILEHKAEWERLINK